MNKSKLLILIFFLTSVVCLSQPVGQDVSSKKSKPTTWILSDFLQAGRTEFKILGKPEIVVCKYGNAVQFNGASDGIFLDQMPLAGLKKFTLELLLCPAKGGNFEQRYFHSGEVKGNRVMMELRSNTTDWYLDAFFKSGDQQKALIETSLTHRLDQWAHVAFVVDRHKQQTFVNGHKELESKMEFQPFESGKTSVGVRQNELSWFKGAIYQIRITPKILKPSQFFKY